MQSQAANSLLVIVGPTAVGKTEFAIQLAERIGGEIISADSRYFYRGMDIGTAKPSSIERARVPHHLIDILDPDERYSLAVFQAAVDTLMSQIHARCKLPMLVGGTGQYVSAIVDGWELPSLEPDHQMRDVLEQWGRVMGAEEFHRRLAIIDPLAASRIEVQNLRRVVRAFEVIFKTGNLFSRQQRKKTIRYCTLKIGLIRPREELYSRIDARIDQMIQAGLVDEVKELLLRYPADLPAFSAIGYRDVIRHLQGKISLDEAVVEIKRATRNFVRRQANWFKLTDPTIHWINAKKADACDQAIHFIQTPDAWIPAESES